MAEKPYTFSRYLAILGLSAGALIATGVLWGQLSELPARQAKTEERAAAEHKELWKGHAEQQEQISETQGTVRVLQNDVTYIREAVGRIERAVTPPRNRRDGR